MISGHKWETVKKSHFNDVRWVCVNCGARSRDRNLPSPTIKRKIRKSPIGYTRYLTCEEIVLHRVHNL